MKILTGELLAAFRRVRWKYRSTAEMAKAMGVSGSMMSRILRGKTSHISDRHWITMRCIVEPAWCGKPCEDVVAVHCGACCKPYWMSIRMNIRKLRNM